MSPYNKLWTKTAFAKVPALYATEDVPADEKIAHVKIFSIGDDQRWYVLEYDPETGTAFCLHWNRGESELGYSSIEEMQSLNNRPRIMPPFERDSSFGRSGKGWTVAEIKASLERSCPA